MFQVRRTAEFDTWLRDLRDRRARVRIAGRIERIALGDFGDHRSVGGGVFELRLDLDPGYRVYVTREGPAVAMLLCGGDKSSQERDIVRAQAFARALREPR